MADFEDLRGSQQQLSDEFLADYMRMTDPEERQKEQIKNRRTQRKENLAVDAGL